MPALAIDGEAFAGPTLPNGFGAPPREAFTGVGEGPPKVGIGAGAGNCPPKCGVLSADVPPFFWLSGEPMKKLEGPVGGWWSGPDAVE